MEEEAARRVWMLAFALGNMQMAEARRRRMQAVLLLHRRRQAMRALRGPYCTLEPMNRDIVSILDGDPSRTKEHIRVAPYALHLFAGKLLLKGQGWSTTFEAILFLYWLGCGSCFRIVACVFNVPRTTAHRIVHRVLNETVQIASSVIYTPMGDALEEVGMGFADHCRSPVFRQVAGAIDGCQVRTMVPTVLHDQYINQKLYYSILLQGVCDHRGMFIDIFVGLPGSVHDMRALRHSHLYRTATYPPPGWYIIGDKGYACIRHPIAIIPPYKEPLTPEKRNFNYHLSKGRCLIERVFGAMEIRWRSIYTKALEVSLETGVEVLTACAVMHNICVTAGEILATEPRALEEARGLPPRDEASGAQFRDMLLQLHNLNRNQEHV